MEFLRPWLHNDLLQDVRCVLDWRDQGENIQARSGVIEGRTWEDDDSNLRISSSNQGQCTQVLKWENEAEPVRAAVSDSQTRISATFAVSATQEYKQKNLRDFTKGTSRGLLQLNDYDIVLTPLGPKRFHLTLFVRDFKFLGATDARVGSVPRPIEDVGDTPSLLARLSQQWKRRDKAQSKGTPTSRSSPRVSGVNSPISGFATQRPQLQPEQHGFMSQIPSTQFLANNTNNHVVPAINGGNYISHLKPLAGNNGEGLHGQPGLGSDDELVRMLSKRNVDVPTTEQPGASDNRAINQSIQDRDYGDDTPHRTMQDREGIRRDDSNNQEPRTILESVALDPSAPWSSESMKDTAQIYDLHAPHDAAYADNFLGPRKRQRSQLLRTRDVRVPKEQADILAREDAWIPAAPGYREPVANVPTRTLLMLNARAARRANRLERHGARLLSSSRASTEGSPRSSNSYSDEVHTEYSWPNSPIRPMKIFGDGGPHAEGDLAGDGALPPDSSVPTPLQSRPTPPVSPRRHRSNSLSPLPKRLPEAAKRLDDGLQSPPSDSEEAHAEGKSPTLPISFENGFGHEVDGNTEVQDFADEHLRGVLKARDQQAFDPFQDVESGNLLTNSDDVVSNDTRQAQDFPYRNLGTKPDIVDVSTLPTADDFEEDESPPLRTNDLPYTGPSAAEPVTQVARTPYINGVKPGRRLRFTHPSQSFMEQDGSFIPGTYLDGSSVSDDGGRVRGVEYVSNLLSSYETGQAAPEVNEDYSDSEASDTAAEQGDLAAQPFQERLKRKVSSPQECAVPPGKRIKIADLLPTNMTQAEGIQPGDKAADIRRSFFEGQGGATGIPSSSTSPPSERSDGVEMETETLPLQVDSQSQKEDTESANDVSLLEISEPLQEHTISSIEQPAKHVNKDDTDLEILPELPQEHANSSVEPLSKPVDKDDANLRITEEAPRQMFSQSNDGGEKEPSIVLDLGPISQPLVEIESTTHEADHEAGHIPTEEASPILSSEPDDARTVSENANAREKDHGKPLQPEPNAPTIVENKQIDTIGMSHEDADLDTRDKDSGQGTQLASRGAEPVQQVIDPPCTSHQADSSGMDGEDAQCGINEPKTAMTIGLSTQNPLILDESQHSAESVLESAGANIAGTDNQPSHIADSPNSADESVLMTRDQSRIVTDDPTSHTASTHRELSNLQSGVKTSRLEEVQEHPPLFAQLDESEEDKEVNILNQVALESQPEYISKFDIKSQPVASNSGTESHIADKHDSKAGRTAIFDQDSKVAEAVTVESLHKVSQEAMAPTMINRSTEIEQSNEALHSSTNGSSYDRFKAAYPVYAGSAKHFARLCRKIAQLMGTGGFMPRYLWDDFVIRHQLEYSDYMDECKDEGEDAVSYETYYAQKIDGARFTKKVIDMSDLNVTTPSSSTAVTPHRSEFLAKPVAPSASRRHSAFSAQSIEDNVSSEEPELIRRPSPEIEMTSDWTQPSQNVVATSTPHPSKVETIDLTLDDDSEPPVEPKSRHKPIKTATPRSNRKLPWQLEQPNDSGPSRRDLRSVQDKTNHVTRSAPRPGPSKHPVNRSPLQPLTSRSFDSGATTKNLPLRHSEWHSTSGRQKTNDEHTHRASKKKSARGNFDWRDPNTPFKQFVSNYNAIQPASGNSYATERDIARGIAQQKQWLALRPKNERFDLRRLE